MSRKKRVFKRVILPDPKFGSVELAQFINVIMEDGKKSVSEKIVYQSLDMLIAETKQEPIEAFNSIIEKVKPLVEVKSRRIGGATYPVPIEVRPKRQLALAMRWLKAAAAKRSEKTMALRLGREMLDALKDRGGALKKREEVHRAAEANKAFSHYRF